MSADPLLVLQLQRMGDLILTFPLLLALKKRWPGHPLWVAAEPQFFQELMPLAPEVVFFPLSHCSTLARGTYAAVINLSGRPEAAACLAGATAALKLGPAALPDGLHIHGYWQLYRAALTQNNRHNAFHWSDLYRLDLDPTIRPGQTGHILPQGAGSGRVGLVLGASEAAKHPDALFWARLARRLTTAGIMPLFLGGKAEQALGQEAARLARLPQANLCGRLPLREVAAVLRGLDLCITPDTGPMHLADWLGVPVLNLSMGPVHARETGPTAPGQWVLRAAMSCVGCWQCRRSKLVLFLCGYGCADQGALRTQQTGTLPRRVHGCDKTFQYCDAGPRIFRTERRAAACGYQENGERSEHAAYDYRLPDHPRGGRTCKILQKYILKP